MRRFLQFAWGRQPGKTGNFQKIDNSLEKAKRFWCLALIGTLGTQIIVR